MPFAPLLERLKEKTRGRVLRADSGSPPAADLAGSSAEEREAFSQSCVETPLYLEITILP